MDKPPFNDLAQPNMSRAAEAIMQEAMRKSCAEQARQMNKTMENYEKRQIQETDKEKPLVDWTPEYEYETIKCNKTPEEERKIVDDTVKFIKEHYGDVLKRLSKT